MFEPVEREGEMVGIFGQNSLHHYEIPRRFMSQRLPMQVRREIRDLFFVDPKDDSREPHDEAADAGRPAPKRARRATTKDKKVHYAEDEEDKA
ncbi:hypothetical protein PG988_002249 [Apiospora saccharicola]